MSDFEFGGMGVDEVLGPVDVGSWGSFWKKFKGVFKSVAKKVATSGMVKDALNSYSPGAGDAAQKGMQLIGSAASGNPTALAQVKGLADAAKAAGASKQEKDVHDLLTTINDARKEATAEVQAAVGAALSARRPVPRRGVRRPPVSPVAPASPVQPTPSYPYGYPQPGMGQPILPGQAGYPWPMGSANYGQPYYAPGAQGYAPGYGSSGPQGYGPTPYYQQPYGYDPYGAQQPYGMDPYGMQSPYGYDGSFGGYTSEQFPDEGYETGWANPPVDVGSWKSFWKKFKGVFKSVAKKVATSGMVKDALNSQYPGAGDAAQKGMKLIDSAASGNPDALKMVASVTAAAKSNPDAAPAHDLLTTLNDARKEVKAETVTAAVGATMADINALLGRYFKITEKKDGKDVSVLLKITAVHPEAYVQYEAVGMPGVSEWKPLKRIYEAMLDKTAAWTDEKGTPVAVGGGGGGHHGHGGGFPQGVMIPYGGAYDPYPYPGADPWMFEEMAEVGGGHHGGHGGGGFRTFDPRDMYWGPRIDVDDDGQPILVGHHHGGHGGGGRGWGGFGAPWGGMWYPPMWEEVEIVSDEDIAAEKQAKKEAK